MAKMSVEEIEDCLSGPHQAVLSVGREGRGPVAVPMSYHFDAGHFRMITSPDSLHGRLMQDSGRATLTVQYEELGHRTVTQWYVMAEGPVAFTDDDPTGLLRAVVAKDRGAEFADEWTERSLPTVTMVVVMTPQSLSGHRFFSTLD